MGRVVRPADAMSFRTPLKQITETHRRGLALEADDA